MRNAILAIVIASTLVTGVLHAATPKAPPADVGPGHVAWFDITTTNLARSKEFYGKLFDWKFTPVQGTDQAAEIVAGNTAIGTLRVAEGKISAFNGVVYVQVIDIQASCKKAKELGGIIPAGFPFNLQDGIGAIAVFVDPAGHAVGLYSRTPLAPAPARDPAGAAVQKSPDGWYGAAMLEADGTIVLQLRSVQADGTIAEGMIHYPKTHPEYQRILAHTGKLMVGVWKPIPPWPEPQDAPAGTAHPP
jgi:predicted enzyme related to lactoylglutathione lyase